MEHLPGFIIIGLTVVAFVVVWFLIERGWKAKVPTEFYRDVGIRYMPGCAPNWAGMEPAIDAIYDVLAKEVAFAKARGAPFWIYCYTYSADLITPRNPTGFIYPDTGRPAP